MNNRFNSIILVANTEMENITKLRNNYLNMMLTGYVNNFDPSTYKLTQEDYTFICKMEIKLYNNVILYIQEYTGDFKELYLQLTSKFCDILGDTCSSHGIPIDDEEITVAEAIHEQLIIPQQLRKIKELTIEPKFNPRAICRDAILDALKINKLIDFDESKLEDLANRIEQACYNQVVGYCKTTDISYQVKWTYLPFIERYKDRVSIILNHLNPNTITNKTYDNVVVKKLVAGELSPEDIGSKEDTELCQEAIVSQINEINTRTNQKIQAKYSTMYKCPLCHARRCTYQEKQIRSSDESADIFCQCLVCGNRFKGH